MENQLPSARSQRPRTDLIHTNVARCVQVKSINRISNVATQSIVSCVCAFHHCCAATLARLNKVQNKHARQSTVVQTTHTHTRTHVQRHPTQVHRSLSRRTHIARQRGDIRAPLNKARKRDDHSINSGAHNFASQNHAYVK